MDLIAIDNLKKEIENLKIELKQKEDALSLLMKCNIKHQEEVIIIIKWRISINLYFYLYLNLHFIKEKYKLSNEDIARYSRQIIMSEIGVSGQIKLKNSSVLIVGMGGLGCPAAQYLIGAGVGMCVFT